MHQVPHYLYLNTKLYKKKIACYIGPHVHQVIMGVMDIVLDYEISKIVN